jgi:DNA-binding NarL/FixJ family response regulator
MTTNPTMNVYVIDDHPLMREAVVMLLRRMRPGANVVELDRIGGIESSVKQHGAPDLITLDLKLPDTTGTSGVHELKKLFPETPLAVSTSRSPRAPRRSATPCARCSRPTASSRSSRPPTTSCPSGRSS